MTQPRYKTIFFGTPDFAVPELTELTTLPWLEVTAVVTQPDKPVGREQKMTPPPVKVAALKLGLPVWQHATIRSHEFEKQLRQAAPEVIIVVAYGKIIPKNLLTLPKYGWLNIHASLLPHYRGASPIQAAILNGDTKTGVTLMQIDTGLDTGAIITQKAMDIMPTDDFESLHDKLSSLGTAVIEEALLDYLEGKLKAKPQDNSKATITQIIDKEDGRIDWKKPAIEIERQIRAYTPWPSAYCFWNDKRIIIINAKVAINGDQLPAGQTNLINNSLIVGCGSDSLELNVIQMEGKKPQTSDKFLKGYSEFQKTQLS
jgi:methionyl-tRNA formyltransferase